MRLLILVAAAAIGGCSGAGSAERDLAQCRLDAYRPLGTKFIQEFAPVAQSNPNDRKDRAYSSFLITCMEAKGYSYADPDDRQCWKADEGAIPWVGQSACFRRSWW